MAFMITGRHLNVGPLTAEDIEKEQRMPGGFKESSRKGKVREPVTPQRGDGSKPQQRFQQQSEGGDSVEKEAEYEADEEGSEHHVMKQLGPHLHLQARPETAAPKRATANRIDHGHHLQQPNQGKQLLGTSSARRLQKHKNGDHSPQLLPTEGQQRTVKLLKESNLTRQRHWMGMTISGKIYKHLMDG